MGRVRTSSSRANPFSQSSFITESLITVSSSWTETESLIAFSSRTMANSDGEYFSVPPEISDPLIKPGKPILLSSISTAPALTRSVKSTRGSSLSGT